MAANGTLENSTPANPFNSHGEYSLQAVELMRALGEQRRQTGQASSTPSQILAIARELGYVQSGPSPLNGNAEAVRFVSAITEYQQQHELPYPTCEDLLRVLNQLGYHRALTDFPTIVDGLPIDRRRMEEDDRQQKQERRSSPEPSAQERLSLTDDEHAFLDALKELRVTSGREFASSEELLSIIWSLGFRPTNDEGLPVEWLEEAERCHTQMAFTKAVEKKLAAHNDGEFLTCRSFLEIIGDLGFCKS